MKDPLLALADDIQETYRYSGGQAYADKLRALALEIRADVRAAAIRECVKVAEKHAAGFPWTAGTDAEVIVRLLRDRLRDAHDGISTPRAIL